MKQAWPHQLNFKILNTVSHNSLDSNAFRVLISLKTDIISSRLNDKLAVVNKSFPVSAKRVRLGGDSVTDIVETVKTKSLDAARNGIVGDVDERLCSFQL